LANDSVTGEAIEKPEMPDVGVMTLGLTADALTASPREVGWDAVEGKGRLEAPWWPWQRIDR
jgi:hypothetical protein